MKLGKLVSALALAIAAGEAKAEGLEDKQLVVQHSLDGTTWQPRGSLNLSIDMIKKKISLKFSNSAYEMSNDEAEMFKALMKSDALYRIRIAPSENDQWMVTSIPSCLLAGNRFREMFRVHVDKSGSLIGIDYAPATNVRDCDTSDLTNKPVKILSKAVASLPLDAQVIPKNVVSSTIPQVTVPTPGEEGAAAAAAQQQQQDGNAGSSDDQPQEQQSFIRKYWYVFVPIALMSMFGAQEEPQQQGAGGAAAGAPRQGGGSKKNK